MATSASAQHEAQRSTERKFGFILIACLVVTAVLGLVNGFPGIMVGMSGAIALMGLFLLIKGRGFSRFVGLLAVVAVIYVLFFF